MKEKSAKVVNYYVFFSHSEDTHVAIKAVDQP